MLILLTGSTGFLGASLIPHLLARAHRVLGAGRRPCADPRVGFVPADFSQDTQKSVWAARLSGVDVVINTVGIFREVGSQTFATLHTDTPRALFAACADAGVKLVVQVSALGADQLADTPYHLSKKAADDFLATLPLRSHIVQPSLIYGPDGASARLFRLMATLPWTPQFGAAPQPVQPVHIDDVCAAIAALLDDSDGPPGAERIALVGPAPMRFIDYIAALRRGMRMGPLRVLRLPSFAARGLARLGGLLPASPMTPDALRMLDRGNTASADRTTALLGRPPRPVQSFITHWRAERLEAQLGWLLPLLRLALAAVWIWTALVSALVYPVDASYALLERSGVPPVLAPLMLYGASAADLLLGIGTLLLAHRWRPLLWQAQAALIVFYTVVIALRLPEYLWHPYGPLSKNLPMLAALWLLYAMDNPKEAAAWTT